MLVVLADSFTSYNQKCCELDAHNLRIKCCKIFFRISNLTKLLLVTFEFAMEKSTSLP